MQRVRILWLMVVSLLAATAAQAQGVWLQFDYEVKDVGYRDVGSTYELRFHVHAINGATPIWVSVYSAASAAAPQMSPTYANLPPLQAVPVTVIGKVPPTPGNFEDVIRFEYNTGFGTGTSLVRVTGVAQIPPQPRDYSVGVVPFPASPYTAGCPAGAPLVTISMDDEDHNNANGRAGWIGATTSDRNTTFRLCRIDGTQFRALSVFNTAPVDDYAVVRLGTTCPNGSTEFARTFDNENSDNRNYANSSSGNAADLGPTVSSQAVGNSITKIFFCLFKNGYDTMSDFPKIGVHYGVFAASDFPKAVSTGWVYTDDEDNGYGTFSGDGAGKRFIVPTPDGRNTTVNLARVTRDTRPVAICSASPSTGNYYVASTLSSSSYAREGRTLVSYEWTFGGVPAPVYGIGPHQRTFYNPSQPSQTFNNILTVTDSAGEKSTAWCPVTVYGPGGSGS